MILLEELNKFCLYWREKLIQITLHRLEIEPLILLTSLIKMEQIHLEALLIQVHQQLLQVVIKILDNPVISHPLILYQTKSS